MNEVLSALDAVFLLMMIILEVKDVGRLDVELGNLRLSTYYCKKNTCIRGC